MNSLCVEKVELGPIGTNAYLIWQEDGKDAVLIDAPPECNDWLIPFLNEKSLSLKEVWLTHGHWDHMAGAGKIVGNSIPVIGHVADKLLFEKPEVMSTFAMPGINFDPVTVTKWVEDGDQLDLFGHMVKVFHCPGHCPGNIVFWVESEGLCFVGDVIFEGSIGRADLPGGDYLALENSIQTKIYNLPNKTIIYPGHGPNTTVESERKSNPFVRPL